MGFAMIAIGIGFIPAFVRITRAQVLSIRGLVANHWKKLCWPSYGAFEIRLLLPKHRRLYATMSFARTLLR